LNLKIKINEGFPEMEVIINCPEISDEVCKIEAMLRSYGKKLLAVRDNQTYMIDKQDVLYFESVDKRCFIYTAEDAYETSLKLYEIEESMAEAGFFRSSKSQIINLLKITSLCPDFGGRIEVVMDNGEKLIVSRQYSKLLKERLGLK
jgi:DNA-binding LytR/AlgR family response regulator